MTTLLSQFGLISGQPRSPIPLPVGQLNIPEWDRFEASFQGIFKRRYYTNQGPLTQELEERLAEFLKVKHVVTMTNATIGLMISAKALELTGEVITPAFTFAATAQSLTWAGLTPVFCDVDPETHMPSPDLISPLITASTCGILGVHMWGNPCYVDELSAFANERDLKLYFDAAHAFGCVYDGTPAGGFGQLEVFSFHATKILNATEGGCVCTNDDAIAARLRNIRSSYGSGPATEIPLTGNGRMSEAQAAMALLSLEDFPKNMERNKAAFNCYKRHLAGIEGIRLHEHAPHTQNSSQYLVVDVKPEVFGLSRDELLTILQAENILARRYFSPGMHRTPFYSTDQSERPHFLPNTDQLCSRILQLPSGQQMTPELIELVCEVIQSAQHHAEPLREFLKRR